MKKRLAAVTMILSMLAGCVVMAPGHLYPVDGPLSTQTPVPIYKVTLSGVLNSGSMSATLQDGEVCSGGWAAIPQDDATAGSMSADWDRVYGAGFFVANVLGKPVFARATLTGTKGTTLQVQFYDPTPGQFANVEGVARDNSGNVFKLTF